MAVSAVAATTATSTPGTGDLTQVSPMMTARDATPNTSASGWTSPAAMPSPMATTSPSSEPESIENPSSLGTWETSTSSATALR